MIDYEITFKKTGYGKEYFDKYPKSRKFVYRICNKCNKGIWIKKNSYHNLCGSCAAKNRLKNKKNHPMYGKTGKGVGMFGKHHSDETKRKMSDSSPCISGKDHWNYGKVTSDETKEKMKESSIGKIKSDKHKNNMSKNHADFKGKNNPSWQGGISGIRKHVLPEEQCLKLNERFNNSEFHHITKSIGIFIPHELHRHVSHNLKSGQNMGEINLLALQFINGEL